jgi:hypothetical protein
MSLTQNTFVVISEDAELIETVRSSVGADALVQVARDLAEALPLVVTPPAVAVVVDGSVLRGSVVTQLSRLRASGPLVSILFIASELRAGLLNDIQPLRVELLARPLPMDAVVRFVRRSLSAGRLSDLQMQVWIERLASEHKLSGDDLALFPLVLDRETPQALCARLNIDQEALSRGLRRLVKKCRVRNTDRLAKNVMRDALLFSSLSTAGYAGQSASA